MSGFGWGVGCMPSLGGGYVRAPFLWFRHNCNLRGDGLPYACSPDIYPGVPLLNAEISTPISASAGQASRDNGGITKDAQVNFIELVGVERAGIRTNPFQQLPLSDYSASAINALPVIGNYAIKRLDITVRVRFIPLTVYPPQVSLILAHLICHHA